MLEQEEGSYPVNQAYLAIREKIQQIFKETIVKNSLEFKVAQLFKECQEAYVLVQLEAISLDH
jgi:hypothetical protein